MHTNWGHYFIIQIRGYTVITSTSPLKKKEKKKLLIKILYLLVNNWETRQQ